MTSSPENNRHYWHSRRGMLELDLILVPFFKGCYEAMSESDQALYVRLLEEEDQDLFSWLLGRQAPEDIELARMINIIKEHARSPQAKA